MKNAAEEILLNGTWELHEEPIATPAADGPRIAALGDGWIPTPVPGDVRQGLIAAGRIKEPLVGLNALDQYWIEDRSWWFRKTFAATPAMLAADAVELEMHGLDAKASIFLNGTHLGDHPSAFRPFIMEVKGLLRDGENVLLVRLTHGVEDIRESDYAPMKGFQPTEDSRGRPERGDRRRPFVRKPQFTWGWDWTPRVATVCIAGDVKLRVLNVATIREVQVVPHRAAGKDVDLAVTVTVQWLNPYKSGRGTVYVAVRDEAGKVVAKAKTRTMLQSGLNYVDFALRAKNARLWWPAGQGEQYRYTILADLDAGDTRMRWPDLRYGIRFVELEKEGGVFAFRVNGRRIFAKGGNWIPPDCLYARVTAEKLDRLVCEARAANFNMLRIWGGGLYERDAFYEACDREGILLWHDFMLACSPYPDHLEWFRDEVAREADYQTRRLRNHASTALWCGSNELLYCMGQGTPNETRLGTRLLGEVLPAAVRRNCPEIPWWYTSPSGGETPDSWEVGDCHFWAVPMQQDLEKRYEPRAFDDCGALFVSEFGYPGPCSMETTREYLDGHPYNRADPCWMHHMNTFDQGAFDLGLRKHYIDPLKATLEEYIYFGGLTQGLMYGYTLDALRARPQCHGAIFWMYDDTWGEVGWTIVDYYLRRKPSWWFVRRAFAPRRLIARIRDGNIRVILANDTSEPVSGTLECGYVSMDGKIRQTRTKKFTVKPSVRGDMSELPHGNFDAASGLWFARVTGKGTEDILPAIVRAVDFKDLKLVEPHLALEVRPAGKRRYEVTVASDAYAHAVELCLPLGAQPDDNLFDLLPGESRTIGVMSPVKLTAKNVGVRSVFDVISLR